VLDVQPWLPRSVSESNYGYYEDPKELDIYEKMLHETDLAEQRALMLHYNERVLDEEAHYIHSFWWNRLVPLRSYVHGWKIGPSHYSNQDLATISSPEPERARLTKAMDMLRTSRALADLTDMLRAIQHPDWLVVNLVW
jgi:hypothetical protein